MKDNEVSIIGEKDIKICDTTTLKIIGGGSLKTRLGSAILYSISYHRE
jgi:hypothetical protein